MVTGIYSSGIKLVADKRKRFIAFLLITMIIVIGCEHDEGSSNKTLEEDGTVILVSQPRYDGDSVEFTLDNNDVVRVNSRTTVRRQRESCSGFDVVDASAVRNGDYLEFTYLNPDGVDYANRTYTAKHIDAY